MYYCYVIKSEKKDYFYKGYCEDLIKRIDQHNKGLTKSIKSYIPFKLVYFESFETKEEAIKREQYFKTSAGRKFLKNKLFSDTK